MAYISLYLKLQFINCSVTYFQPQFQFVYKPTSSPPNSSHYLPHLNTHLLVGCQKIYENKQLANTRTRLAQFSFSWELDRAVGPLAAASINKADTQTHTHVWRGVSAFFVTNLLMLSFDISPGREQQQQYSCYITATKCAFKCVYWLTFRCLKPASLLVAILCLFSRHYWPIYGVS